MNEYNTFQYLIMSVVVIASLIIITDRIAERYGLTELGEYGGYEEDFDYGLYLDSSCNVAGVVLQGTLYTYYDFDSQSVDDAASAEDVMYALQSAEDAPNIEVILLEIDSYGGYPVAAEETANMIKQYVTKPVVVQIRGGGLSAGYWVASAGDYVFASALSDVGSIGVTMSYVDESVINEREGFTFNELSTGKFKDSGSSQKKLTEEERILFERDLEITYQAFMQTVAENRGMDIETVRTLADGSSMLGEMAKEQGLIDAVGGIHEVVDYIESQYGVTPSICW